MAVRIPAVLATAGLLLAGCSSIVEGTTQQISINTNPNGAACDLLRENRSIGRVDPTPGAVIVKKTKHDIRIGVCAGRLPEGDLP